MTAPVSNTGALYVAPSPFKEGGFVPDSELGASSNILIENSRKRAVPEGESGQPDEPEGKAPSEFAKTTTRLMDKLENWRNDKGLEQTAHAIAAAAAAARDLPGNGRKWEELQGPTWVNDECVRKICNAGAPTFPIYLRNCYARIADSLHRFDPVWNWPEEPTPLQSEHTEHMFRSHRGRGEHRASCYLELVELGDLADLMKCNIDKDWARTNRYALTKPGTYLVRLLRHDGNRPVNSISPLSGSKGMGLHCDASGWYMVADILQHMNAKGSKAPRSLIGHG